MFKGKFVVLSLIAAVLLSWQMMPAGVDSANSGIVNACSSEATSAGDTCWLVCPQGDGPSLASKGATITVTARDNTGAPIPGIPVTDMWLIGCNDLLALCGGSGAINSDAPTDAGGVTTIGGSLAASLREPGGVSVVIQGTIVADPSNCTQPLCLLGVVVSPDRNGDLAVDVIDFGDFGTGYQSPPKIYDILIDYNCDGFVDIIDFGDFGSHYLHSC